MDVLRGKKGEIQLKVGVKEVVEALHEDGDNAETDHSTCYRGNDPMDRRGEARPAEPEIVNIIHWYYFKMRKGKW